MPPTPPPHDGPDATRPERLRAPELLAASASKHAAKTAGARALTSGTAPRRLANPGAPRALPSGD